MLLHFPIQKRIKIVLTPNNFRLLFYSFFFINILTSNALGNSENFVLEGKVKSNFIELQPTETIVIKKEKEIHLPQVFPTFLTSIDNFLLVSNYRNIYVLDPQKATLSQLKIEKHKKLEPWSPSGMYYDAKNRELFISNEMKNNIAVFSVPKINQLKLKYIYSGFSEPKNIACSENNELVVANYSANRVSFYKRNHSKLTLLWEKEITACHGVCILDNKIYACGLGLIVCLDFNGKELYRCHSAFGKELKFPTCIIPLPHSKTLAVTDAKSGYCFLLTPKLKEITYFGGNGIGLHKFNYPYSIYSSKDKLIVSSVYQDRIAFINLKDKMIASYCFQPHNWEWLKGEKIPLNDKINCLSDNILQLEKIKIFRDWWAPSHGAFENKEKTRFLLMPSYIQLSSGPLSQAWYATTYAENDRKLLLLSINSRTALLIDKKTGYIEFIDLHSMDCWGDGKDILTPQGKRHLDSYHFLKHSPEEFYQRLPFTTLEELADFIGIKFPNLKSMLSISSLKNLHKIIKNLHVSTQERNNLALEFIKYISNSSNSYSIRLLDVFSLYALTNSKNGPLLSYSDIWGKSIHPNLYTQAYESIQNALEKQQEEHAWYLKIIFTSQPKLSEKKQIKLFDIIKNGEYPTNILGCASIFIKPQTSYRNRKILLRSMRNLPLEKRTVLFKNLHYFSSGLPDKKIEVLIRSVIGKDKHTIDSRIVGTLRELANHGFSTTPRKKFLISFLNLISPKYRRKLLNIILNVSLKLNTIKIRMV